jgi:Asp/Glu/hydantoin racemase
VNDSLPSEAPTLLLIEKKELDALVTFAQRCQGVLVSCSEQVNLLTAYRKEADQQITGLSQSLVEEQAKPRMKLLYFVPPFVVGLLLGLIITR